MQETDRETRKRDREDQELYDVGFEAGLEEGLERAKKKLAAVKDEMVEQEQVLVTFQKTESKMKSEIETMKVLPSRTLSLVSQGQPRYR
jgi:flagellar biosynthesis/type III secretory pathway protein FliH